MKPTDAPVALAVFFAALLGSFSPTAGLRAQTGDAPILHVEGRPMLRATLRSGDAVYMCHLLLDLTRGDGLFLHRNAVSVLKSETCDVTIGGIELTDVGFTYRRDTWLERLTAQFATELNEVPVAGILGVAAFGDATVVVDGPGRQLRVQAAGTVADDQGAGRTVIQLPVDPRRQAIQFPVVLERSTSARFVLHTREPFGFLDEDLAKRIGKPTGVLTSAVPAGPEGAIRGGIDFAQYAPLRPGGAEAETKGGIGARTLQQLVLTIELRSGRLVIRHDAEPDYSQDEADFYKARYGTNRYSDLKAFVTEQKRSGFRHEAARTLLTMAVEATPRDPGTAQLAALAAVESAKPDKKGGEALAVLEDLPADETFVPVREALIRETLPMSRADIDGTAGYQLRVELGRIERRRGNLDEARRHLMAAAFGDASNGVANLELGRLHETAGELERARGRYFLAMLDARRTGEAGLAAFIDVQKKLGGEWLPVLEELGDGRIPALHPIPREPEEIKPTGRVVLIELFTGAQCPPCVAADVAADALAAYYRDDEVALIQWHLPIPAPEPLVAGVSQARAQRKGIRGTPTAFFGGDVAVGGGGEAKDASAMFGKYQEAIAPLLLRAPEVTIEASAQRKDGDVIELRAAVTPARGRLHAILVEKTMVYPGRNGMVFHHNVARAALTPANGADAREQAQTFTIELADVANALDATVTALERDQSFLIRPTTPNVDQLAIILFVEEPDGRVLQAATIPVAGARG
jgi:hypothetical protein